MSDNFSDETYSTTPPVPLPASVSAIRVQKKRKGRYSIFIEDQFVIGISEETLIESGVKKGDLLDQKGYNELVDREYHSKLKNYVLSLLARRDYTRTELQRKCTQKGYDKSMVLSLLDYLQDEGLQSDQRMVESYVRDKFKLNQWGPAKIKSELMSKGVSGDLIDHALDDELGDDELFRTAKQLLNKKRKQYERESDPMKRKQKMARFLAGRGFPPHIAFKAIDHHLK